MIFLDICCYAEQEQAEVEYQRSILASDFIGDVRAYQSKKNMHRQSQRCDRQPLKDILNILKKH